ncbi:DNA helicase [Pseudomonas phage inbricus]|uniref:DNA helicase n=1 Tax=Pseudomonas phage inbricus TaxID=2048976 RepID=A0A2H4P7G4_9CAUD|nr:exonuclease V [Pseudomonas phage inbricus]ATW58101.1 DNA helicase [Pseudomonas phage inbricus]
MDQIQTAKPLNSDQEAAAEGFFQSLFDPNVKELNISGPGGVGKTFTMAHMIDVIMPQYYQACEMMNIKPEYDEVVMTATTNKAAEVLATATNRPTSTIHAHLGLTVKNNYATGEADLIKSRSWNVKERQIVFIDEASMIESKLRNYVNEGLHKSKIIYVGDHCQLAPIKEELSPVYTNNLPMFELTIPMRTDKPELLALNQMFRDIVEGRREWGDIKLADGIIDHVDGDRMEAELNAHFLTHTNSRVLAYTNNQVGLYTDYIRGLRGISGEFVEGEELVSNSAVRIGQDRISIEQEVTLIERSTTIEAVRIDHDTYLDVRVCTLDTGYGGLLYGVKIPVDMAHFNALVKHYGKVKNWERYFYLKETFPDFRSKDACTVHKSQGSTYDTVFVDVGDLSTCRNPAVAARLFYVAFSRARNRVVLYGNLAERFGRIVH